MTAELERNNGQQLAEKVSPTGYHPAPGQTFEEWQADGEFLWMLESALQFAIGDWINHGERVHGQTYSQALSVTKQEYSTLSNYKYVASSVPEQNRMPELSWSHHRAVAPLDPPAQRVLLQEARDGDWSKAQLEREAKAKKDGTEPAEPEECPTCHRPLPRGKTS